MRHCTDPSVRCQVVAVSVERTPAEEEFLLWLDLVAPAPIGPFVLDPNRDYAQEKADKVDIYRHRYLMKHSFWYRQNYVEGKRREEARIGAELQGKEYVEPE